MEILFDGNIIKPAETAVESLGILFSKECIPYAQIEQVRSNLSNNEDPNKKKLQN